MDGKAVHHNLAPKNSAHELRGFGLHGKTHIMAFQWSIQSEDGAV